MMDFPSVVSLFVRLCVCDNMHSDWLKNASEQFHLLIEVAQVRVFVIEPSVRGN